MRPFVYMLILLGCPSVMARPAEGLLLGSKARATSGAYASQVTGVEATLGNPALLGQSQMVADLSILHLDYRYKHPSEAEAQVVLTTPILELGFVQSIGSKFSVGAYLLPVPKGAGKLSVERVPIQLPGAGVGVVDVTQETLEALDYSVAVGAALQVTRKFTVGLGLQVEKDSSRLALADGDLDILTVESIRVARRGTIGVHVAPSKLVHFGLYGVMPAASQLKGRFTNAGGSGFSDAGQLGPKLGLGLGLSGQRAGVYSELLYERRSLDRKSLDPLSQALGGADLDRRDTLGGSFGLQVRGRRLGFVSSFGYLPSGVGDGLRGVDVASSLQGVQFGDLAGVSRLVAGLALSYRKRGLELMSTVSGVVGSRTIGEAGSSPGSFNLWAASLGGRIGYTF